MSELISLPDIPILKNGNSKYNCPHCQKGYKLKAFYDKHVAVCVHNPNNQIPIDSESESGSESDDMPTELPIIPDKELQKLKCELQNILIANPNLDLNRPVNTLAFDKIETMSSAELKSRIFEAKRALNQKLDQNISSMGLNVVNIVVGKMLGCLDELNDAVANDKILQESARDLLTFNILSSIPIPIKTSGLYAMNVAVALKNKAAKNAATPPSPMPSITSSQQLL